MLHVPNDGERRVARGSKFPDPTDPTRPVNLCGFLDPTRPAVPFITEKVAKLITSWNCYVHIPTNAPQIRYALTGLRFHWLQISLARMPQLRQLNTDQTPPLCSQISCTYYSLEANERIASSLYAFCAPIFTALHAMQSTRSSDENSVRLSVCPSVRHTRVLWQNGRKICPDLYTIRKII